MQKTEHIVEKRPPRATQVVPMDPSLRYRYRYLIFSAIILLVFIFNFLLFFNEMLFSYSFFDIWVLQVMFILIFAIFPLKPWKIMDQRRQQAARYNITTGLFKFADAQPQNEAPILPEYLVLSVQRRWGPTWIISLVFGILLCGGSILAYTYGEIMLQEVQSGTPIGAVVWEISLNLALLLIGSYCFLYSLIIAPRQHIIATHDGLFCRQGYRKSFIPWHQARLFAIIGQANINRQEPMFFYELASAESVIRWPSVSIFVSQGIRGRVPVAVTLLGVILTKPAGSAAEFPQQVQFLNSIIAERTGLPLYDLR